MANYPVPYQQNWGYSGVGQQMYPAYQQQSMMQQPQQVSQAMAQGDHGLKWVDGEVGAKAYQMPAGWPPNTPIALWDTNDTVIYLKSVNPMGMPNPLQKAHYKLENYQSTNPMRSGDAEPVHSPDLSEYVKKTDLEKMKQDLMDTIGSMGTSGSGVWKSSKGDAA